MHYLWESTLKILSGTLDAYPAFPTVTNENIETLGSCAPEAKKYQEMATKLKTLALKPKRDRKRLPLAVSDI